MLQYLCTKHLEGGGGTAASFTPIWPAVLWLKLNPQIDVLDRVMLREVMAEHGHY